MKVEKWALLKAEMMAQKMVLLKGILKVESWEFAKVL
jgi:hypothetical protein